MATIQGLTKARILEFEDGLGTASTKNIPATGNASATEVVFGTDTRLTNTRNTTNPFSIRFDSGTTTGTDAFSFNGSTSTSVVINAGTNIGLTKGVGTGVITINNTGTVVPAATGTNDMIYATGAGTWARFAPGTGVRTALTSAVTGSGGIALATNPTFTGLLTMNNALVNEELYTIQLSPTAKTATATLTATELLTGIITHSGGSATYTLPTAALLDAAVLSGALPNGGSFDWSFIAIAGAVTMSVTGATSHTYVGSTSIASGASALFRSRKNATQSFTTYRIS